MSFELAPGTLLNNRYQIKKVIAFAEDGGVYLARDLKVTDRNWIVKEIIPSASLDEETLAERKLLFVEAVESIMQFDHPDLSRVLGYFNEARREYVVMEHVEGVTLQTLCDMSVNPLPEKQILGWSLQMCDALSYLHNRPKPFILHALSPAHIILTSDEKVKIINYGLDRFFATTAPPRIFTDAPTDILNEFARFGETTCFLLTKEKPGAFGLPANANVSPELAKLINRCLQGESQKTYANFEDLKKNLDAVLHPPEVPKKRDEPAPSRLPQPALPPEWVEKAWWVVGKILSQRRAFLIAEIALAMIVLVGLWLWKNPTYAAFNRTEVGPIAYFLAAEGNLITVSLNTQRPVYRNEFRTDIADVALDNRTGQWLYLSDRPGNRILRLKTSNNELPERNPAIPVDRGPGRLVIDQSGARMYAVHEGTHNVSRINLTQDPPQMDSIMAVGHSPRDLTILPDGETLYVTNYRSENVSVMQPDTNKTLTTIPVSGNPDAVASTPDGKQVWVCCEKQDFIVIIDTQTNEIVETLTDYKAPSSIVFSPDGTKAFVANNGSNNVSVIEVSSHKVLNTITTPASPDRLIPTQDAIKVWLTSSKPGITILDLQVDRQTGELDVDAKIISGAMLK
ncbi:MAG: hypothetical protein FJX76_07545 [Armatimonadetes bacterium]|nr:hypothetical protein [Armatimonadota bacterium]